MSCFYRIDWYAHTAVLAGLYGDVGYNINLLGQSTTASISHSSELYRKNGCIPAAHFGSYLSFSSNCVLSTGVTGSASFVGDIKAAASFSASAQVGGGFLDSALVNLDDSSWNYQAPTLTNTVTSGSATLSFDVHPYVELTVTLGYQGMVSLSAQVNIGIKVKIFNFDSMRAFF